MRGIPRLTPFSPRSSRALAYEPSTPPSRMNTGKSHNEERAAAREAKRSGGFTLSPDPVISAHEDASSQGGAGWNAPAYEDLGELPATYHEDLLFLIARDPRTLFAYWDFDWTKVPVSAFRF